jgi:hypothetical protein
VCRSKSTISEAIELCEAWLILGNKWAEIARKLERTEYWVKIYWRKILKSSGIERKSKTYGEIRSSIHNVLKELKVIQPQNSEEKLTTQSQKAFVEGCKDYLAYKELEGLVPERII